jgi:hypothetical protein
MLQYIDYSRDYFEQLENATVPNVRDGKFVQIVKGEDEYVVFSPKGLCKYHSHIVDRFAELQNLAVSTNHDKETVEFDDTDWRIVGGGKMRIDDGGKTIELGGSSQAYGPFERTGLTERLAETAELIGYSVTFAD